MAGPANARTDPDNGLRIYTWQGLPLLSVTSLRRLVGVPFNLSQWMVSNAIKAAMEMDSLSARIAALPISTRTGAVTVKDVDKATAEWKRQVRVNANEKRDGAADLGTRVHESVERLVKADPKAWGTMLWDEDVIPFLTQYIDASVVLDIKVHLMERQVWSPQRGYAGSLDQISEVTHEGVTKLCVVDLKSGEGVYTDHLIQLALYTYADFIGANDVIDIAATKMLQSVQGMGILHLRPDHWEWIDVKVDDQLLAAAEGMTDFAVWLLANNTVDNYVVNRVRGAAA